MDWGTNNCPPEAPGGSHGANESQGSRGEAKGQLEIPGSLGLPAPIGDPYILLQSQNVLMVYLSYIYRVSGKPVLSDRPLNGWSARPETYASSNKPIVGVDDLLV